MRCTLKTPTCMKGDVAVRPFETPAGVPEMTDTVIDNRSEMVTYLFKDAQVLRTVGKVVFHLDKWREITCNNVFRNMVPDCNIDFVKMPAWKCESKPFSFNVQIQQFLAKGDIRRTYLHNFH